MAEPVIYSLVESASHPDFSALYRQQGFREMRFSASRKLLTQIKKSPPDYIVAEFFYGFANNYAGVNISNLDVMLFALQKYAKAARVVVLVSKAERCYVDKLNAIFPLYGVLEQPVNEGQMKALLRVD